MASALETQSLATIAGLYAKVFHHKVKLMDTEPPFLLFTKNNAWAFALAKSGTHNCQVMLARCPQESENIGNHLGCIQQWTYLHRDTALQFQLELNHVDVSRGAKFVKLCRFIFDFISSNINGL